MVAYMANLDENVMQAEVQSSFPSLKLTLVHMAWAENIWLNRLTGEELKPHTEWKGLPSPIIMDEYIRLCRQSVKHLTQTKPEKEVIYRNTSGDEFVQTVEEVGVHLVNHASYHRGQLVTMLRHHNLDNIPAFDFIAYCRT